MIGEDRCAACLHTAEAAIAAEAPDAPLEDVLAAAVRARSDGEFPCREHA